MRDVIFVSRRNIRDHYREIGLEDEDTFIGFSRYEGQSDFLFNVDLAAEHALKDGRLSWLVTVTTRLSARTPKGLATSDARPSLEALDGMLADSTEFGRFVGSMHGDGHKHYYHYAQEPPNETRIAAKLYELNEVPTFNRLLPITCAVKSDPTAETYRTVLFPTIDDLHDSRNRDQILEFQARKDDWEVKRNVEHYCLFVSKESAESFREAVGDNIYLTPVEPSEDKDLPFRVVGIRNMELWPQHVWADVVSLRFVAEENGGTYDGWAAAVMPLKRGLWKRLRR